MQRVARGLSLVVIALAVLVPYLPAAATPSSGWVRQTTPNPGTLNNVWGVATTGPSDAWAVGCYTEPAGSPCHSLFLHYDGAAWTALGGFGPGHENLLEAVTATSTSNAWAVGSWRKVAGNPTQVLIEHYDGVSWHRQAGMIYKGLSNGLDAVDATSDSNAWAVGSAGKNGVNKLLSEHYDGTSWKLVKIDSPGQAYAQLYGVATLGPVNAWAVGFVFKPGAIRTLIERHTGAGWTHVISPNHGIGNNSLNAVSARSSSDIWAVGDYGTSTSGRPLIEHYDGRGWHLVPSPPVDGGSLMGVTAVASNDVWAAGSVTDPIGNETVLIEHYDGVSWTVSSVPSTVGHLTAVDASDASNVFAVGYGDDGTIALRCC